MSKRILIIEDDPGILELLQLIFEDEGYLVDAFISGKSALDITAFSPDIIILDIRIAGYDQTGDEICAELKAILPPYTIPVLLISAENNLYQLARACKSDGYMAKPFNVERLLEMVSGLAA